MFILLFSDTHGNHAGMKSVIESYESVDLVIHLGDCVKDVHAIAKDFEHLRFELVPGNNDYGTGLEHDKVLLLEGYKIWITHGHHYGVKYSLHALIEKGHKLEADAVFYGHTHLTDECCDGKMRIVNPGSLGRPSLFSAPTYCEVHLHEESFQVRFKTLSQ